MTKTGAWIIPLKFVMTQGPDCTRVNVAKTNTQTFHLFVSLPPTHKTETMCEH